MAAGLYGQETTFTAVMDEAFELLGADGRALRRIWLAPEPAADFDDVTVAQPLLYSIDVALGQMVLDWGVTPVALLGHSIGELAAATLAGVLDFADGIRMVRTRMRQFARTPAGGMLAVAASVAQVQDLLSARVHLAAVNATRQVVLSGERDVLQQVAMVLASRGTATRDAGARQAFHSPLVQSAVDASIPDWLAVSLNRPRLPVYSAYTQCLLTDEQALDHRFWARQPAETVYYAGALGRLLADHDCLLVEAGPGASLSTPARRHPAVTAGRSRVVSLLPDRRRDDDADRSSVAAVRKQILEPQPIPAAAGG